MKRIDTVSTTLGLAAAITLPASYAAPAPVAHRDHFWFARAAFAAHTSIWTAAGIVSPGGRE